jgi:dipeptidyl aminopeptidase/acylaminoacyl peptidase
MGGEAQQLTEHETSVGSIAWSPDGAWIYFQASDDKTAEQKAKEKARDDVFAYDENHQQRHLLRVNVETGEEERVSRIRGCPCPSPWRCGGG